MGKRDYYKRGEWNARCDRCGAKFKSGELDLEWDKFLVCRLCWEPRHPQDFVRGLKDDQTVPISRPPGEDKFITTEIKPEDL
jgi:hypothetical protein